MIIPSKNIARFVRNIADQCLVSQQDRINRGQAFQNYALFGSDNPQNAALFNKTFAYIDDLESLLYSPISLRFHIGNPDLPNIITEAKGRAAATHLRGQARKSDTDTCISEAVWWSLVKGKTCLKQTFKGNHFSPTLIQPESLGVLRESHNKLDENMEAFCHSMLITPYQFRRLIWNHPDRRDLERKAKRYMKPDKGLSDAGSPMRQIVVGSLYPFQPAGSNSPNNTRGIVDWMQSGPVLAPAVAETLMQLDEVWIWDDQRHDWATFQIIGDNILLLGEYYICNALAWDAETKSANPELIGHHPFVEFCPNRLDGNFWGRSEIVNVALIQEAINARINGINKMLRMEEQPPLKFLGMNVNQSAYAKFNKPGGYLTDSQPNGKIETLAQQISKDLWASLHEYYEMFDEMGGLPPIAKGRGESGVRSQAHAETLVRMFSPRFKDRALLVERSVEELGGLMLDLAKAHIDKDLTAWTPPQEAGLEAPAQADPMLIPPAPGFVPVKFKYSDIDDDCTLTIDAHSSSPAFSAEARALVFDLFKIGAMSAEDVVEHVDAPDPEELQAGITRRAAAVAQERQRAEVLQIASKQAGGKK